jgi:hypothetical protein
MLSSSPAQHGHAEDLQMSISIMKASFDCHRLDALRKRLEQHPVFRSVEDLGALRIFMDHHVYAVWDFMSLVKFLQREVAPAEVPWSAAGYSPAQRHFINALVLSEESDQGLPDENGEPTYASHFALYCQGMREIGAEVNTPLQFVEQVRREGIHSALRSVSIPEAASRFVATTFDVIESARPHAIAAALAFGREEIIPPMFRALLQALGVCERDAPAFHHYLRRHIHLDEETHGPMAIALVDELCQGDPGKLSEAQAAAQQALEARILFWDNVLAALKNMRRDEHSAPCSSVS